jgi:hypothetical protein
VKFTNIFFGGLLLLTLGCSTKYISKKNYLITIKTKNLKYSDIGIISKSKTGVKVDIFSVGNQILKLEFEDFVSVNGETPIPYSLFNSKFFNSKYPNEMVKRIFRGEEIFGGKNKIEIQGGFEQKIGNIKYKATKKMIVFRDQKSLIKIKLLQN